MPRSYASQKFGAAPPFQDGVTGDAAWRQTEKMLAARTFRAAAAQRSFLRYVVSETIEGRGELLKEYSIGVAVFHKKESFDPRLDSIVRTQARKLRARLTRYYEGEGRDDRLRIEIPTGQYAPVFRLGPVELRELTLRRVPPGNSPSPAPHRSALRIAVLPFANRGSSKKDELFSDGLTDELTHAFTRIPGLEVVARTSAFQFKGERVDVREVGRRLGVQAVVEGSIRRSGERLRVLAQLDDTFNGQTVWSQTYDRKLADLFAVQQDISATITNELGNHFAGGPELIGPGRSGDAPLQMNPRVYEEYLRGQYFWNRHTVHDFEAAIDCFQRAIAMESRYARAWANLAWCYIMVPVVKAALTSAFVPRIRSAAAKHSRSMPAAVKRTSLWPCR